MLTNRMTLGLIDKGHLLFFHE